MFLGRGFDSVVFGHTHNAEHVRAAVRYLRQLRQLAARPHLRGDRPRQRSSSETWAPDALITLHDLLYRYRQFLIAVIGAGCGVRDGLAAHRAVQQLPGRGRRTRSTPWAPTRGSLPAKAQRARSPPFGTLPVDTVDEVAAAPVSRRPIRWRSSRRRPPWTARSAACASWATGSVGSAARGHRGPVGRARRGGGRRPAPRPRCRGHLALAGTESHRRRAGRGPDAPRRHPERLRRRSRMSDEVAFQGAPLITTVVTHGTPDGRPPVTSRS